MDYKTYVPQPALAAYIKCYWTLNAPAEIHPEKQRIVPDGCMEMIFHYGDRYRQYLEDGTFVIQPQCFVFGQVTKPLEIEPAGQTGIFAVRFQPDGFTAFATLPASDMENRAVPLPELFGTEAQLLETQVLNAVATEDQIRIVETFLLDRLITPESVDTIIRSGVEVLLQLNGQLSVDELSDAMNINRRQLERKFSAVIGLSPKQLSKIIRLQAALKMLAGHEYVSLTAIAHAAGYYDQAHFIRDFREFTGMSPKKFYAGNLKMSSLFSGGE